MLTQTINVLRRARIERQSFPILFQIQGTEAREEHLLRQIREGEAKSVRRNFDPQCLGLDEISLTGVMVGTLVIRFVRPIFSFRNIGRGIKRRGDVRPIPHRGNLEMDHPIAQSLDDKILPTGLKLLTRKRSLTYRAEHTPDYTYGENETELIH